MPLFLQTFGHPRLTSDGSPVHLHAKELALLVYLRATCLPQARGAIGSLLWGKTSIGRNHSVNNAVSALRRALPPGALPPGADPVALAVEIPCDLDALAGSAADARQAVRQAVADYRAPFLDGFEFQVGEGGEGFVEWMLERREAYRRKLVEMLEDECSRREARRDWPALRALAAAGAERVPGWHAAGWMQRARRGTVRRRWERVAAAAVLCGVLGGWFLRPLLAKGPVLCGGGEARAHLVRQIYPAEANTAVRPGERYTPVWFLKNVGECAWRPGARLVRTRRFGPAQLEAGPAVRPALGVLLPPDSILALSIPLRGPRPVGPYGEDWQLLDAAGKRIAVDGTAPLQLRFQRLPPNLPRCRSGQVRAELLGQSHPGRENPMHPGQRFLNTWTLVNRSACVWDGSLSLRFASSSGPVLSTGPAGTLRMEEAVDPTDAYTFSVPMRAPVQPGAYRESWRLVDGAGHPVLVSEAATVDVHIAVFPGQLRASAPECAPGKEVPTFMRAELVEDGAVVAPGALVAKEWTLDNHGDCTWAAGSLRLRYHHSDPKLARGDFPDVMVDQDVPPTGTFTFRAPFHAPTLPGHYRIHWQLQDRGGRALKVSSTPTIWADVVVRAPSRRPRFP